MATFTFNSPDGKQYTVEGPDSATHDEAFAKLQEGLKSGAIKADAPAAPAPAAPAAPPEPTPMLTQLGHAAMDVGGSIARGVGATMDVARNVAAKIPGSKATPVEYGSDDSEASQLSRPFQHEPDVPNAPERGAVALLARPWDKPISDANTALVQAHPGVGAAEDIAGGIGAGAMVGGIPGALRGVAGAADTAINRLRPATADQAARVSANQQIVRMRADGYKVTADDVRGNTNPADTSRPNADLPGPSSTTPDVADSVSVHNQARATQTMAKDVNLPNTRNINPDEVSERMAQEGKTYGQVGDAIGTGRTPTPVLDHDLSTAAVKDADPAVQAKIDKDVQFYRDHFDGKFDGPNAVETVRTLRNSAQELSGPNAAPGDQARARTYQNMANAVEDEMMRQLPASAQDLRAAFPAARQQLAKLYELNEVTEGGQVNAAKVAQLKAQGQPLTGAADAVANAAQAAPQSMQGPRGSPSYTPNSTYKGSWLVKTGKAIINKLPGLNPTTDAYQAAKYGETGGLNATPPASAAPRVSEIRPPVGLTPPGGQVGREPPQQGQIPLRDRAPELKLEPPEGQAGGEGPPPYQGQIKYPTDRTPDFALEPPPGQALEPAQRPLARRDTAGNVMDPAEWDRQALARVRAMTPPERAKAEGPAVPFRPLANNASGESAASQEAINRVGQEQAGGITRYVIHQDDTATPLRGVTAVDAKAQPGDVIVQMKNGEPTILDRGGLPQSHAMGRVAAAISKKLLPTGERTLGAAFNGG